VHAAARQERHEDRVDLSAVLTATEEPIASSDHLPAQVHLKRNHAAFSLDGTCPDRDRLQCYEGGAPSLLATHAIGGRSVGRSSEHSAAVGVFPFDRVERRAIDDVSACPRSTRVDGSIDATTVP
jgi:hypothetical protein